MVGGVSGQEVMIEGFSPALAQHRVLKMEERCPHRPLGNRFRTHRCSAEGRVGAAQDALS